MGQKNKENTSTDRRKRIKTDMTESAVTADLLESFKILLNCMISENANCSTIDLTDFYLGTPLPHLEYNIYSYPNLNDTRSSCEDCEVLCLRQICHVEAKQFSSL
jgi:hypothetical protein